MLFLSTPHIHKLQLDILYAVEFPAFEDIRMKGYELYCSLLPCTASVCTMSDHYDARRNHPTLPPDSLPPRARTSTYSSLVTAMGYQSPVPQALYGRTLAEVQYNIRGSHTTGVALAPYPANVQHLVGTNEPFFGEMGKKASIRVNWPGYEPYTHQCTIKDARINANPISIARSVQLIADEMRRAINMLEGQPCTRPEWRVGRGFIQVEHLILMKVAKVANGSLQPHFAVRRQ